MILVRARALALLVTCALGAGFAVAAMPAPAGASSAPAPGVDDDWTRGAHELLALVPREIRETCDVHEPDAIPRVDDDILDARRGALICKGADGAITTTYTKFTSSDAGDAYLDQIATPEETEDVADDPGDCPTQFRIQRDGEDGDVGRYTCFLAGADEDLSAGTPVITWTYEPLAVVAQAYDTDLDLARLRKFWSNDAGPLSEADQRGIPPIPTAASLRTGGKRLLASVPEASRRACNIVDSLTPDALGSAFPSRLWIVADVEECRPKRGSIDTEYMQFANAAATDAFMGVLPASYASDRRITVDGTKCGGTGTYQDGGRRAGRYMCWFSTDDTDAQESSEEFAHLRFSDARNRLVVTGGAPAATVKALLAWWQNDARVD
jgi:hypothetical protein